MAVTNSTFSQTNAGMDATGPYPITFRFDTTQPREISVILTDADGNESTLTYTSDYSVVGSNLYTVATYDDTYSLKIFRSTEQVQEVDLRDGTSLSAQDLEERGMDRLQMQIQEIFGKSIRVGGGDTVAEITGSRPGMVIVFNASGDPVLVSQAMIGGKLVWDDSEDYVADDIVYWEGYFWKALDASTDHEPEEDAYWTVYRGEKGDTGDTGDTGATGDTGPKGDTGVGFEDEGSATAASSPITVTHNYGSTDYRVLLAPTSANAGYLGDYGVQSKTTTTFQIYWTGSKASPTFDWALVAI